jgi:hypothetical protein
MTERQNDACKKEITETVQIEKDNCSIREHELHVEQDMSRNSSTRNLTEFRPEFPGKLSVSGSSSLLGRRPLFSIH